jgi:hypothetical protein
MNRGTIRKLYRDAILTEFGCNDKEMDSHLISALKKDVHLGNLAPGKWSPDSVLEIYCENGIPNASDINDFRAHAAEFGVDPSNAISYNSDNWRVVDGIVNLMLEAMGVSERVHHEPYSSAVVNIYWS